MNGYIVNIYKGRITGVTPQAPPPSPSPSPTPSPRPGRGSA